MRVVFCSRIDAPKRSGEKKRVHDELGFYSHRPSLVGGITVYEIAEELVGLRAVELRASRDEIRKVEVGTGARWHKSPIGSGFLH